ncbi:MAG TPA: nucleoside triphosphate pyrophosphohydrolase [Candidatus Competibacteraceae bacterium]|nr:nucleoside triphosphate pyrophosphohydrolase [Candidatus Competibacteraceae bacterium]
MAAIDELIELMTRLRDPENGCPWDRAQTYRTIVPYTLEEAHEVAEAIEREDYAELKAELGDLLFQVVFYAQMAKEEGRFDFEAVARAITDKMIRRHPHVFGDRSYASLDEQKADWERIKQTEKGGEPQSVLDGVPASLPALTRALKLQKKAARVGFDWGAAEPVLDKIEEEIRELRAEIAAGQTARAAAELGDLLFAVVNLARHLRADPEQALRDTNRKFERRFQRIEHWLAERGRTPEESTLEEMDALWERAKREERGK